MAQLAAGLASDLRLFRLTLAASLGTLMLRIQIAQSTGFGDAEALYASYALFPQPAYLDHPGLIGALGGVGLRSTGRDGRFIALRGIRELRGELRAGEIVARSGVDRVESEAGEILSDDALVDTRDWVRPVPREGLRVLRVRREGDRWVPAERRTKEG